ncbi:hypothetical protein Aph01nite_73820 [Acrocarpospora phusangensis]|uniref:Uncharacterized protein n=1 Tax=Acrocarpospora phusangensis TaxID=1070424 RepID=A0A919USD5_9ACTN|nr:hypothetical protein [Acrocarpospora phusangensis]GIH29072.1 hypothetical protein Aph01nite_73820 [Acrocarpospora phusangensis]
MIPTRHDLQPCPARCGQQILWTRTAHGARLAVEAKPDPTGNQAVMKDSLQRWVSRSMDGAEAPDLHRVEHLFRPHFIKGGCPKLRPVQPELPGLLPANVVPFRPPTGRRRARR